MNTTSSTPPLTESIAAGKAEPKGETTGYWAKIQPLLRSNGLIFFFLILLIGFTIARPEFLSEANIRNILLSASVIGMLAIGQTVVMLTGGFDLSVAKNAAVVGIVVALLAGKGPIIAILVAVLAAAATGIINGVLISRARVNPFVVTLGMFTILTSVALLLNNGAAIGGLPEWLSTLVAGNFLGLPVIVWWFVGLAVIVHLFLVFTKTGRHVYAVGGNLEASRLAGIRTDRVLITAYVICAICAGIGGIALTARLGTASPVALPGAELDAIAAVIIGGTRLSGGFGSVPRTIIGVLILQALSSGLVLLGVAAYWQGMFKGAIIILAVAVDVIFSSKKR